MLMKILLAVASLSVMGLVLGAILGYAAKIFHVKTDDRLEHIQNYLPGANCGGCGYAGCAAFSKAILEDGVSISLCGVAKEENRKKIAEILGVDASEAKPVAAKVLCSGCDSKAKVKYDYLGIKDCNSAFKLGTGLKECKYSCIGFGTCVGACKFDAIEIKDGIAFIDADKCTQCGACVLSCPKGIIKMVPKDSKYTVLCSSEEKGAATRTACDAGCIACKLCEKACEFDAIKVENNIAIIDYDKCTNCGACVEKCPRKIIVCNYQD